jgi:hypothetical protein
MTKRAAARVAVPINLHDGQNTHVFNRPPRGGPDPLAESGSPLFICNTFGSLFNSFNSVRASVTVAICPCPRPHGRPCSSHMATLIEIPTLVSSWPPHESSIKTSGSYALSPHQCECRQMGHRLACLMSNVPSFLSLYELLNYCGAPGFTEGTVKLCERCCITIRLLT